jgi:hypothetical protein
MIQDLPTFANDFSYNASLHRRQIRRLRRVPVCPPITEPESWVAYLIRMGEKLCDPIVYRVGVGISVYGAVEPFRFWILDFGFWICGMRNAELARYRSFPD